MNLILLFPNEINNNLVTLRDRRSQHISTILKSRAGDTVRIGIINGPTGSGRVLTVSGQEVVLEITADGPVPPKPLTDLILALPRPIMLKRVLAQAAALGVGRIFLINANRVEKSFFSATMVKQSDFKEHLIHGLEQGMDTRLPEISIHERFRPFSEDLLPVIINDYPVRLIAHPEGNRYLFDAAPRPADQRALLAIGPEGGWVDFEVEKFKAQGLILFSMGPRILRVDSAVPALLSQIDLLRRMTAKQPCV
ncbi:MAG: 16S rRNA (uracil(1498)-N(3))-methyltransferase [Deltaproteobacteria bacterium RIFOXYD12_FULL_50_9]|nr:MAG: 16S rRNA (uracil(1498)-N(3))-methyltransferase [Deltaproteobacteria bacterium RIFOXYD12_FULL_50_9]